VSGTALALGGYFDDWGLPDYTPVLLFAFPLLILTIVVVGWLEHVLGSSPPGHGDLEQLLARKERGGFAAFARRVSTNRARSWRAPVIATRGMTTGDDLSRLLAAKARSLLSERRD
jgi:hypothetical protein